MDIWIYLIYLVHELCIRFMVDCVHGASIGYGYAARDWGIAAALRAVVTDYFCSSSGRDDDDFDSDLDSDMDCDSDNYVEMEEELPEIEDMDI